MNQSLSLDLFPSGFPSDLAAAAFVASNEAAWRPALAARSVEWLGTHGYPILGTELSLPKDGSIQSLPYFQKIDRQGDEAWYSFVARAAAETLAHLRALPSSSSSKAMSSSTWKSLRPKKKESSLKIIQRLSSTVPLQAASQLGRIKKHWPVIFSSLSLIDQYQNLTSRRVRQPTGHRPGDRRC